LVLLAAAGAVRAADTGSGAPSISADNTSVPPECNKQQEEDARAAQQGARQQKVNGNHTANPPGDLGALSCLDGIVGSMLNLRLTFPSIQQVAEQALQTVVQQVAAQVCKAATAEWSKITSQAIGAVESAVPGQKTSAGGILGTVNGALGAIGADKVGVTATTGNGPLVDASGAVKNLQSWGSASAWGSAGNTVSQQATTLGNQISNAANKAGAAITNSASQAGQAASSIFGPGPNK
jgi:hypothetical protein